MGHATAAAALGASLLILVAGPAAAADEPAGPTAVVQAAADEGVRASLRFPAGWRLESVTDPARLSIDALEVDERCELSTRRSAFDDPLTDVDDFVIALGPGSGFELLERTTVELPAGLVERVDLGAEDGGRWSVYVVPDSGYMHELWCLADELPDDRWLPIAETFDIEPDPTELSSRFDPVVARPDAGVAMAFGEEWQVRGSSTELGLLYATSPATVYALSDYSTLAAANGWTSVDDMHVAYLEAAVAREGISVMEAAWPELPAGRIGVADLAFEDGTRGIRYSFGDAGEGALVALFCVGDPVPGDRYLPLAESVTWLAPQPS
jgi:hypothetical protein